MTAVRADRPVEEEMTSAPGFDDFELKLGDVMRGERATLGKSLLDVQRELRIRAAYVAKHPLCEQCEAEGRLTPVAEVHHIRPLAHGGTHDENNLMSLCKPCHSRQTALDGDRWRKHGGAVSSAG